jgi:hypothetical protein
MLKNIIYKLMPFSKADKKAELIGPFVSSDYQQINVARLRHLSSLGLMLDNKSVLEFGAGIGDHTYFYLTRNCKVLPTDGRKELVDYISTRFNIPTQLIDVEKDLDNIKHLSVFDIIHCYGLLYHIKNPSEFLFSIKDKSDILLLETCVSLDSLPEGEHLAEEDIDNPTQAVSGIGCRPTRLWIYNKLKELYPYVYMPKTQPDHHQFPANWDGLKEINGYIRAVFVASKYELVSSQLSNKFVKNYIV